MHFAFTDDQLLFRDTVRDLLANECKPEVVRDAWTNDSGRVPGLWGKLVDMGVAALTAPEGVGGLGMNEVDLVLLQEEAGRAAMPDVLIDHTAVALPLLAEVGESAWLTKAAAHKRSLIRSKLLIIYGLYQLGILRLILMRLILY